MSEKYALIENEKIAENISLIIDYFREVYTDKNTDKGLPQKSVEKFKEWVSYLEKLNSDYEDIIADYYNENKSYIFLSGHEDEKVYIDGDTCYEVSERIPGLFTFGEAQRIVNLVFNKDWKLPNKDELRLICENLIDSGFIQDTNDYWSSSSYSNDGAWLQSFRDRNQYYNKNNLCSVRAIRPFKNLKGT